MLKVWRRGGGNPPESLSPSSTHHAAGRHRRGADGAKMQGPGKPWRLCLSSRQEMFCRGEWQLPQKATTPVPSRGRNRQSIGPVRVANSFVNCFAFPPSPRCRASARPVPMGQTIRSLGRAWVGNVAASADSCDRKKQSVCCVLVATRHVWGIRRCRHHNDGRGNRDTAYCLRNLARRFATAVLVQGQKPQSRCGNRAHLSFSTPITQALCSYAALVVVPLPGVRLGPGHARKI